MGKYTVDGQYGKLFEANHIDLEAVLRQAGLPMDTFETQSLELSEEEYFRIFDALETVADDPVLSVNLVKDNNLQTFSPPILAAYCSRNGEAFLDRLARYKNCWGRSVTRSISRTMVLR